MAAINFFTFKWGTKYGPEYVNRLYGSLRRHCSMEFNLTAITDNTSGIDNNINTIDYTSFDPFPHTKDKIFTREKLVLFDRFVEGKNCLLDLDILIHDNIDELINQDFPKPKFIWNYWNDYKRRSEMWYGKGVSCHVNSSVVMWEGTGGRYLYNLLKDNEDKAFFTYKSLDKFLFYQAHRKGLMDFWDEGIVSNFNREWFQKKGKISIFNTSHILFNKGITEQAFELDEVKGWAEDLWKSYY